MLNFWVPKRRVNVDENDGTGLADFIYLYIYFLNVLYDICSKFTVQQAEQLDRRMYHTYVCP